MTKKKSTKRKEVRVDEATIDLRAIEELLQDQHGLGLSQAVFEPSEDAVTRLSAIPLLFSEPSVATTRTGAMVYDSWSRGPLVALRDVTDGYIRRIQLRAGNISLEIVAEMNRGRWEFVARVYRRRSVVHDFVINIGRKKLLSESGGFYRWSSKTVPRKIGLISLGQRLTFERLSW